MPAGDDLTTLEEASMSGSSDELALALLPFRGPLSEALAAKAVDSLARLRSPGDRADLAMLLRPLLPSALLPELARHTASLHDDDYEWDELLVRLGRIAPDGMLPRVLELVRATADPRERALALFHLLPRLPDLLGEATAEACRLCEPTTRSYLLAKLVGRDPSLLDQALAAIDANPYEAERESLRQTCLGSLAEAAPAPTEGEGHP